MIFQGLRLPYGYINLLHLISYKRVFGATIYHESRDIQE